MYATTLAIKCYFAHIYACMEATSVLSSKTLPDDVLIEEGRKIDEILFSTDTSCFVECELVKRMKYRLKGKLPWKTHPDLK